MCLIAKQIQSRKYANVWDYKIPISRKVNELYNSGKTVKEIQTITGLSAASVSGYLPYQKTIYNLEESSLVAERLRKYRNRKAAVHQLAKALENGDLDNIKETLWNALVTFEGYPFKTAKGLRYYYTMKGNELFFLPSPPCKILLFGDFIQSRVQEIDLVELPLFMLCGAN